MKVWFCAVICLSLSRFAVAQVLDSTANTIKADTIVNIADTIRNVVNKDTLIKKDEPKVEETSAKYDTIFKRTDFAIVCKVIDKNLYEIKYIKKGEKLEKKISTRDVKTIHYASGKIDIVDNSPEKVKKDWVVQPSEVEWKRVKVVTDEASVGGMIDKGDIDADYEAKKMMAGNDVLERNAIAILQKKALALKASVILVVSKEIKREYGEIPSIKMTAKAYGKE